MKLAAIAVGAIFTVISFTSVSEAAESMNALNPKQQSIVSISAFGATGNLDKLKTSLNEGLDAGLTVNEVKELLVQLYAYAGFPRSLNAIATFQAVVNERKAKGINDAMGKEPSPFPTNRSSLEFGAENQTKLIGQPVGGGIYGFVPAIDQFLKAHLFGDIFQRDNLDWQSRELATIAILASIDGLNLQLQGHMGIGIYNGLSAEQIKDAVAVLEAKVGSSVGKNANEVLNKVLSGR
jgi:alkylhydroperoxidase/carboxymuconolactone decarboxylase family protein YurZ